MPKLPLGQLWHALALTICLAAMCPVGPAAGATRIVRPDPAGLPVLQDSLDACQHGDTVLVEPGDYQGHFVLQSGVTLRGRAGTSLTTLRGDGRRSVLQAEDADSLTRVEGFTITGGHGTRLPGARYEGGGGIVAARSALRIRDNVFLENQLDVGHGVGGAVALFQCPAVVERNRFEDNYANWGGALYALGCSLLVVRGNHALHNRSVEDGGGFFFDKGTAGLVEGNVLERNYGGWGGAIEVGRVTLMEVRSNTIVANGATQWGGGIFVLDSQPLLIKNLIAENRCDHKAGGLGEGHAALSELRCNLVWHNTPDDYLSVEDSTAVPASGLQAADPGFCNYLSGNFHPTPGGPADSEACGTIGALEADCPKLQKIAR